MHPSIPILQSLFDLRSPARGIRLFFVAAVIAAMLRPALGATEVRGQPADMQLRLENAPLREILHALSDPFKLKYQLPANVSRVLSGIYSGNLRHILARILDGNNYIIHEFDGGIEVIVLGPAGTPIGVAASGPAIPAVVETDNVPSPELTTAKPVPALTSFR